MLAISHGTSVILFLTFIAYLYFYTGEFTRARRNQQVATAPARPNVAEGRPARSGTRAMLALSTVILVAAIAATGSCAYFLVGSIDGLARSTKLSQTFASMILIPSACNMAQYLNLSVRSRIPDEGESNMAGIGLVVKEVVASVLNITLLVTPSLVLLGWLLEKPMALNFDMFEAATFILAIMVVDSVTKSQKATYFEGVMLIGS
jgi:Ca2+:H+ antiporter